MRSKAAKIVLWILLGFVCATLLSMGIILIVDAAGGTGTTHHWAMPLFSTLFMVFAIILVLAYLLTEPSFKKKPEDEEELYTVDRDSYVKKAKQPRPVASVKAEEPAKADAPATTEDSASEEEKKNDFVTEVASEDEEEFEEELDEEELDDEEDAEEDGEEISADELPDAAVVGAAGAENTVYIRYRRSFMSRRSQASDETKGYYADIKNKLLSYKGVKARTSWGFESYNCGRNKIAKMNVRGKTLVVYFAIEPSELEAKYRVTDMSEKSRYSSVPSLLRVKSSRKIGRAHV